jgi:uncharacterized membrane protein
MNSKKTLFITQASVIAALYAVLVLVFQFSSFGPVQFRVAEALTVLPFFTPAAIPGLAIGCFISNLISGADVLDIIFGSLATLIAAFLSYKLRKYKFLVPIPPILVNALVVPLVLKFAYFEVDPIPVMMVSVGAGQFVAAGVIGLVLLFSLDKVKHIIFKNN